VDEAQNLEPRSVEELRMLSNFQIRDRGLIQSVLVGQPELRQMIRSPSMEQLRQRIIASYHLEAMNAQDTRSYIVHRLSTAGWKNDPLFSDAAFDRIFTITQGLPRRINQLCNRLMLSAFLSESHLIEDTDVDAVSAELDNELGIDPLLDHASSSTATPALPPRLSAVSIDPAPASAQPVDVVTQSFIGLPAQSFDMVAAAPAYDVPTIYVVVNAADDHKADVLLRALHSCIPPNQTIVIRADTTTGSDAETLQWPAAAIKVDLRLNGVSGSRSTYISETLATISAFAAQRQGSCFCVLGSNDASLSAALAAAASDIPVVYIQTSDGPIAPRSFADLTDRVLRQIASVIYDGQTSSGERQTEASEKVQTLFAHGALTADALAKQIPMAQPVLQTLRSAGYAANFIDRRKGYGLVVLDSARALHAASRLSELTAVLGTVSKAVPLIWPVGENLREALSERLAGKAIQGSRLALIPQADFFQQLGLLKEAAFVLTDCEAMATQALAMNVPCLHFIDDMSSDTSMLSSMATAVAIDKKEVLRHVSSILDSAGEDRQHRPAYDGKATHRLAQHLTGWLNSRRPIE
jgi:general secretion pathway protein A